MPIVAAYRNNKRSRSVQLVARNRQSRTEVEFSRSVQLVARKNTLKNHRTLFRTEGKSFVHQDARYERISESRTEVESFVQQVARYARKNTPQKPPHFIPHRG